MPERNEYREVALEEGSSKPIKTGFASSLMSVASLVSSKKFLYFAACVGNLASLTSGVASSWTSPEIPKFKENGTSLEVLPTLEEESWIGSLLPVGGIVGPFFAGFGAEKFGRKYTLLLGNIPFILAFLMACFAKSLFYIYVLRFLCGLGVGITYTVLPIYIAEIADDEVRGQLGSFMQLFITVGLTFSYAAGPYMTIKYFNILCLIFPALFLVLFFVFIPESPYYLLQVDKNKEAEDALMKLRSSSGKGVKTELESIRTSVEETKANKAGFMDIFASRSTTKAFIISLSLIAFQQLSGINVIIFYAQDIFKSAGSTLAPEISAILIGVVQILSSGATPMLVERSGKRFLLLISAGGMTLSLAVLAYYFHLLEKKEDVSNISLLPIACLIVFIIVYCLGFGPLPWAVMGELFPGNIKSIASTCTASFCWILGFLITKYFSLLSDKIGQSGSFGFFSLCCLVAANFTLFYLPETTGKSLQEIQLLLSK